MSQAYADSRPLTASGRESLVAAYLVSGLLVLMVQGGVAALHPEIFTAGDLVDPDDYMRLSRVLYLWHEGNWFDPVFPRVSPPEGLISHWTRPMDVVLIAGALALSPVLGFEQGLHWWGVVVAPLLHAAAALAMIWAARPLLRRDQAWLAGIFVALQPGIIGYLAFGRPDHHGLLVLASVLYLGGALRLANGTARPQVAWGAGLAGAVGLWVSVQILPLVVVPLALLGLRWLAGEDRAAAEARRLSTGLFLGTAAALLLERGWVRLTVEAYDTLSIVHVLLFALTLAFWVGVETAVRRGPAGRAGRLGITALGAAIVFGVLWRLAPGFFSDPFDTVESVYRATHHALIKELQPALLLGPDGYPSWAGSVVRPIFWLGIALPTVPWIVHRLWVGAPEQRRLYQLLGLYAAVYVPLGLYQLRWAAYSELVLVPAYTDLAGMLLDRVVRGVRLKLVPVARPLVATILGFWVLVPIGWSDARSNVAAGGATDSTACEGRALARWLNDLAGAERKPLSLLVLPDIGPALVYRTRHAVNAIPTHRPQSGFVAGYRIMTATDFAEAEALLHARGFDAIVTCPGLGADRLYEAAEGRPTLYRALKEGRPPDFLERIGPPETELGNYRVFQVTGASAPR